jgi:DNA-binding CsgD family transcriptional regulator
MKKKKLKTMNEISAAEAVKLFRNAMIFESFNEGGDEFQVKPSGFPNNVAARDFLETLSIFKEMWRDGMQSQWDMQWAFLAQSRTDLVEASKKLTNNDVKRRYDSLTATQRRVYDALTSSGSGNLSNEQIADRLYMAPKTLQSHIAVVLSTFGAKNRRELATS